MDACIKVSFQKEFIRKFVAPLTNQCRWDQHQNQAFISRVEEALPDENARFNCLAQSYFVS